MKNYVTYQMRSYLCSWCGKPVGNLEGNPYFEDDNDVFCPDCALKLKKISALDWLKIKGFPSLEKVTSASYQDGVITYLERYGSGTRRRELRIFDERGNYVTEAKS